MKLGDMRGIVDAVNEACIRGGGGPPDCCPACQVFHAIKDMEVLVQSEVVAVRTRARTDAFREIVQFEDDYGSARLSVWLNRIRRTMHSECSIYGENKETNP